MAAASKKTEGPISAAKRVNNGEQLQQKPVEFRDFKAIFVVSFFGWGWGLEGFGGFLMFHSCSTFRG